MRDVFWNRIYEIARNDSNLIILSADMGAPALDKFRKELKSQFINTGIAEQNTILIGTGLALSGKKVFVYSIAPFISLRCCEQIKIELAGMNLALTIVGVGAGFSYEDSGLTHHALEDISIIRAFPNMTVNNISDNVMAAAFADISYKMKGPNYLRLERRTGPDIYKPGTDFSDGLAVLKESNDLYIIATGNMVHQALEISKELAEVGVIDLYSFPINEKLFLEKITKAKKLITLEEHFLAGGMGSAVAEVLADNNRFIPLKRLGLDQKRGYCHSYGGREKIRSFYGIDKENIIKTILNFK